VTNPYKTLSILKNAQNDWEKHCSVQMVKRNL